MTGVKAKPLSARQEQFCREFLVDLNATRAAIRAGYSRKTAKEIGHENLTKPHISARINAMKQDAIKRVRNEREIDLTIDRVLEQLCIIAFSSIFDFIKMDERGFPVVDSQSIVQKRQSAALQHFYLEESGSASATSDTVKKLKAFKIRLWNPVPALAVLLNYLDTHDSFSISIDGWTDTAQRRLNIIP